MPTIPQRIRNAVEAFKSDEEPAPSEQIIQEQINPTAIASSPTQEDWY